MSAISFYTGGVVHRRHSALAHKLRYRIAYILLDLDRMTEANRASRLFGIGRRGLLSFRAEDHGDGASRDLASWVRAYLVAQGISTDASRIELLTLPRMFGFVFNPISVYFIRNRRGALSHILYQVTNTFSERHFYLCDVDQDGPIIDQSCEKRLYVSPFFDVEGAYRFKVQPPGDTVALTIRYDLANGEKGLTASLFGSRKPVTTWRSALLLAQYPFMTLGVVAGIHWQAFKLWLKGAKYRSRSAATELHNSSRAQP